MRACDLILRDVHVVDVVSGSARASTSDVIIDGGRVIDIVDSGSTAGFRPRQELDGGGRWAMPGMIDTHCHALGVYIDEPPSTLEILRSAHWAPRQMARNLSSHLRHGVTTVRDMMAPLRLITFIRNRSHAAGRAMPRIFCAGPMVTVAGGYPVFIPQDRRLQLLTVGPMRVELQSQADARRQVDRIADAGADWLKLCWTSVDYDEDATPIARIPPDLFVAAAVRASERGLRVAVHQTWLDDLDGLLALGVHLDTIEHVPADGLLDPAVAQEIADRSIPVTTNMEIISFFSDDPVARLARIESRPDALLPTPRKVLARLLDQVAAGSFDNDMWGIERLADALPTMTANVRTLHEAGVKLAIASDAGAVTHFGTLVADMRAVAAAGVPIADVIRGVTCNAADALGRLDLGRLEPGATADVLLFDRDPLGSLDEWVDPAVVLRDGVRVVG